jgi:hypothetical protein
MTANRGKMKSEEKIDGLEKDWRFGLDFNGAKACLAPECALTFQARRENAFA